MCMNNALNQLLAQILLVIVCISALYKLCCLNYKDGFAAQV